MEKLTGQEYIDSWLTEEEEKDFTLEFINHNGIAEYRKMLKKVYDSFGKFVVGAFEWKKTDQDFHYWEKISERKKPIFKAFSIDELESLERMESIDNNFSSVVDIFNEVSDDLFQNPDDGEIIARVSIDLFKMKEDGDLKTVVQSVSQNGTEITIAHTLYALEHALANTKDDML